jgi:hypothetical protein
VDERLQRQLCLMMTTATEKMALLILSLTAVTLIGSFSGWPIYSFMAWIVAIKKALHVG